MSLTDTLKTVVPECMADEFRRRANRAGCTVGELLRDLVCQSLEGVTFGEHVAEHRRRALLAPGLIDGQSRTSTGPIPFEVGGMSAVAHRRGGTA